MKPINFGLLFAGVSQARVVAAHVHQLRDDLRDEEEVHVAHQDLPGQQEGAEAQFQMQTL